MLLLEKPKSFTEKVADGIKVGSTFELNKIFENRVFSWSIFGVSFALMFISSFLKADRLVGGWHIVLYLLVLIPLVYMVWREKIKNKYTKYFLPILLVMIWDMFYYSNDFVQYFLPMIFYILVAILYFTSMHEVHSIYQTLLVKPRAPWSGFSYVKRFLTNLFVVSGDRQLYLRVGLGVLTALPFLGVFVALFLSADRNFSNTMKSLFDFDMSFNLTYIFSVPWYFALYILLFVYSLSSYEDRSNITGTKPIDKLVVGIFLGMINLLFLMFVASQIPFLLGKLPIYNNLAEFAREGFFQLMLVMAIVLLISLFIMRRFKNEKIVIVLLGGLLIQTIIMGFVSLKKMHLYQSIKGATVMRYYVEWFDYFLLLILFIGLVFLIRKINFRKFLNVIAVFGLLALIVVSSLNIDAMVASHNIEKFKDKPSELDKVAISKLSIDALPSIQATDIVIKSYDLRDCSSFSSYHIGYCAKLNRYGGQQYKSQHGKSGISNTANTHGDDA